MKKVLSFLLAFSFILSLIPSQVVVAESPFTIFLDKAKFYQEIIKRDEFPAASGTNKQSFLKPRLFNDPNGQLNGAFSSILMGKLPLGTFKSVIFLENQFWTAMR